MAGLEFNPKYLPGDQQRLLDEVNARRERQEREAERQAEEAARQAAGQARADYLEQRAYFLETEIYRLREEVSRLRKQVDDSGDPGFATGGGWEGWPGMKPGNVIQGGNVVVGGMGHLAEGVGNLFISGGDATGGGGVYMSGGGSSIAAERNGNVYMSGGGSSIAGRNVYMSGASSSMAMGRAAADGATGGDFTVSLGKRGGSITIDGKTTRVGGPEPLTVRDGKVL
ncbi:MAG: hypothetical protein M1840_001272 [Geoglossum simile]|nr:MAG: hypothetical protein M1840_001272 [Geoglossum simile]